MNKYLQSSYKVIFLHLYCITVYCISLCVEIDVIQKKNDITVSQVLSCSFWFCVIRRLSNELSSQGIYQELVNKEKFVNNDFGFNY